MSNLPKYALELKNRQFSRSGPQNFVPVQFSDDNGNDAFYNNNQNADFNNDPNDNFSLHTSENNRSDSNELSEADKLRGIISDLQDQISRLQIDFTETDDLQQQIENERLNGVELSKQVEEASQKLKGSQESAKAQEDEVSYFESVLAGKNELATAKENMLIRLHTEYDSLMSDYKRILGTTKTQAIQIRQAKEEIDDLQREIEDLRNENSLANYDNFSSPPPLQTQPSFNDFRTYPNDGSFDIGNNPVDYNNENNNYSPNPDYSNNNQFSPSQFNSRTDKVPAAMRDSLGFSFMVNDTPTPNLNSSFSPDNGSYNVSGSGIGLPPRGPFSPTRTGTPRAMTDNISFNIDETIGNGNQNNNGFDESYGDQMSNNQIQNELTILMKEKEETEKIVNRSPPKGMPISRARRIRQENEDKLDLIDQKMGKLRLLLRQRSSS